MTTDAPNLNRTLVILQGIHGSGKSRLAAMLIAEAERRGESHALVRADDWLCEDGRPLVETQELLDYAVLRVRDAVATAMLSQIEVIVVDAPNTRYVDVYPLLDAADDAGYTYQVLRTDRAICDCSASTSRYLPDTELERMRHRMDELLFPEWAVPTAVRRLSIRIVAPRLLDDGLGSANGELATLVGFADASYGALEDGGCVLAFNNIHIVERSTGLDICFRRKMNKKHALWVPDVEILSPDMMADLRSSILHKYRIARYDADRRLAAGIVPSQDSTIYSASDSTVSG